MGKTAALPTVSIKEIEQGKKNAIKENDAWYFLFVFTEKYQDIVKEQGFEKIISDFTDVQIALYFFTFLHNEVMNGGFIQLIFNGYGSYIFDSPLSGNMKDMGAEKIARIVDRARVFYEKYKTKIEAARAADEADNYSFEAFSKLYKELVEFEPLDNEYYEVNPKDTEKIQQYIETHLKEFAVITE